MMRVIVGCFLFGLCLATAQGFLATGKQYEYQTEVRIGAGTMDLDHHWAGTVYRFTLKLQVPSLSQLNFEISNVEKAQYAGRDGPSSALTFTPGFPKVAFSVQLEKGLFKSLDMPAGLTLEMRNVIKAWASTFQLNGDHMKAHKSFKSQEQTVHGGCDISYTVTSDTIYKTVNHNKDCPNRVMRKIDDIRGYDCEWEDKDKASGLVSTASTIYTFEPLEGANKITAVMSNGAFVSQMFETEGVSYIAVVNSTSILKDVTADPGGLSGGGDVTTSLTYEWADTDYQWNTGRDLKAQEPFFASGTHFDEDQGVIKAALMERLSKQKELLHDHDNGPESVQKAHQYGVNQLYVPMWAMSYDTLMDVFNELTADKSEDGILKANVFTEVLSSTGTTASAMVVRDLVKDGKFDNARDAARTLTSVPYHIRRPNLDLVAEFEKLLTMDLDDYVKTAAHLSLGHLVRMTCERAGPYDVMKACFMEHGSKYAKKFYDKFASSTDREEKTMLMGAISNIRYGGLVEILTPVMDGTTGESSEFRSFAVWAMFSEAAVRKKAVDLYLPVYADRNNDHEVRIAAFNAFTMSKPTTTDMARAVAVLRTEKDYELINFVFARLESMAGSISPCDRKSKSIAGFFLKYLKQFSRYNTDWGFGVSKTYQRQFTKAKYGYSGTYSFTTVGAHDSTTPLSIGMGISTTLRQTYVANSFYFHFRIEGLAKGLIRKFKTMDPAAWKTADLEKILTGDMQIAARQSQPVRVSVMVMVKGNIALVRTYQAGDSGEGGKLEGFLKRLKGIGSDINHQRVWKAAFFMQEQPTEIGLPATFGSSMTAMFSLKASGERKQNRGLIYLDAKYNIHMFTQATNLMIVHALGAKQTYGISQDRVYHLHIPRELVVGVNPPRKELKLSVSRPEKDHPAMFMMHAQTHVHIRDNTLNSAPNMQLVSRGPEAAVKRTIFDRDNSKWGYKAKAEYFDCEMDISRRNTLKNIFGAFMPYNKNPKTPWTSVMMGMRQVRAFLFLFPRAEKCGIYASWSQSSQNPVRKLELSVRGSKEDQGERLFLRGRKLQIKAVLKAIGDNTRAYRMTVLSETSPGGLTNKLKVEIDRAKVSALDIKPYSICMAYLAKYPPFSKQMFDVDMNRDLKMSGKAQLKYGEGEDCDDAEGVVNVAFEYSTTAEARESLKKKWYYQSCMDTKKSPAWQHRQGLPISEPCYMTAYDASNARKYKYDIKFEKMTDRMKTIITTGKSIIKAAMLPYMDDAESIDVNEIGGFMKMEATLKDSDKVADVVIETVSGVRTINDYPVRLDWSNRLRNLKFTKTYQRLHKMGIIKPCQATSDYVQTMDNVTYSYEIPSCWTLMSGHCAKKPSYAVFVKRNGGKHPVAMKAFIGGHVVDIDADAGSVKVNGNPVSVSDDKEYFHKVQAKEIFKITKWGSTYNIYSFLRVWIVFDGNFVNVIPAPSVKGEHCGLCGNYNRNKYDEMEGKDGSQLASAADMVSDYKWQC